MKLFIACIILFLTSFGFSQNTPSAHEKLGGWYILDGQHRLADKYSIRTAIHVRTFEFFDNMNLTFYNAALNHITNKNLTLTIGYCYLDIDPTFSIAGESHLYENRPYEEITFKHQLSNLNIGHRLRLEHRFLNFKQDNTIENRFRYRIGAKLKINNFLYAFVHEELFLNLEGKAFTENRLTSGFEIPISRKNFVRMGYFNHEINRQNLHRILLGLFIKTDLRGKKSL